MKKSPALAELNTLFSVSLNLDPWTFSSYTVPALVLYLTV